MQYDEQHNEIFRTLQFGDLIESGDGYKPINDSGPIFDADHVDQLIKDGHAEWDHFIPEGEETPADPDEKKVYVTLRGREEGYPVETQKDVPEEKSEQEKKRDEVAEIGHAIDLYREEQLRGIERFNELLNEQPNPKQLKEVPVGGGQKAKYIPIQFQEAKLDQLFLEWSMENVQTQVIFNEITVTLDIVVRSPITGNVIRRAGTGAAPIQQKKVYDPNHNDADGKGFRSATIEEFQQTKQVNAVQSAFPAAKAFAFSNAVKSLGELFGRNINRDDQGIYKSVYGPTMDAQEAQKSDQKKIRALDYIESNKDKEDPDTIRGRFSEEFLDQYPEVRDKLEELDNNENEE